MRYIILAIGALFLSSATGQAGVIYQETFDGSYTPFLDSPQIAVTALGASNLNGFTAGSSSAGGNALALTIGNDNLERIETVAELDLSSQNLDSLILGFSVAADTGEFENDQIDKLQILLDGISAPVASFTPLAENNSSLSNGTTTLNQTFFDFEVPFSAFAGLVQSDLADLQIQVLMAASSGAEHMGVDSITVTAVPEPASWILVGVGGIACYGFRRRRKLADVAA